MAFPSALLITGAAGIDLDEINRSLDALDSQSISPGQDLRQCSFDGLWSRFRSAEFIVDRFELNGDPAVVRGRLRTVNMKCETGLIPLKETFHRKLRRGKTPN